MTRPTRIHSLAAFLAGLVFVSANTAPVVCAAVHHSGRQESPASSAHHMHGSMAPPVAGGPSMGALQVPPPTCMDMGHCGLASTGIAADFVTIRVASAHPAPVSSSRNAVAPGIPVTPPTPPPKV